MSEQLLPCPFCGGDAELHTPEFEDQFPNSGTVMCMSCYVASNSEEWWPDAVTAWNTRSTVPPWRPIETAPKQNYADVYLFGDTEYSHEAFIGHWQDFHNGWFLSDDPYRKINPTHWTPLPEPPKTKDP